MAIAADPCNLENIANYPESRAPALLFKASGADSQAKMRPSDWVERLACNFGAMTTRGVFCYSPMVRPVMHNGQPALRVQAELEAQMPAAYACLMQFAMDNPLMIEAET